MELKLMDVTLRESVHVNNTPLTINHAKSIVEGLSSANIDYIEIGYISSKNENNYMPTYCPLEYVEAMGKSIVKGSTSKLVLMLYPHQYSPNLLKCILQPFIGLVRLCISIDELEFSIPIIKELKKNNILVSANLIRASSLSNNKILQFTNKVEDAGADYIYIADSNGAMIPQRIREIYTLIRHNSNMMMGFHPHNNLHIAAANALEAIDAGASVIDCSLYGFGKGFANLSIEAFVATLNRIGLWKKKDLNKIVLTSEKAYNNFIKYVNNQAFITNQKGILIGYHDINLDIQKSLEKKAKEQKTSITNLLLHKNKSSDDEVIKLSEKMISFV